MTSRLQEIQALFRQFLGNWPQFLLIHIAVNIVIFSLLAPAATTLLHLAVLLSGDAALSDQEILFFFISPLGFFSLLAIGSVFSIILFLEHAALLTAAWSNEDGTPASIKWVLMFLLLQAAALFRLALLVLMRVILNLVPFLVLAAVIYYLLLSSYDINYYLAEKPAEWRLAISLGALLIAIAGLNLVRLFISWIFCLPLLLFNGLGPAAALRESRVATRGRRLEVGAWLIGWLLFSFLLAALASALVAGIGNHAIPFAAESVNNLLVILSLLSVFGFLLSLTVTFVTSTMLSLLILKMFGDSSLGTPENPRPVVGCESRFKFTPNRYLLAGGLMVALVISILVVHGLMGRLKIEDRTEIMAHRGASASAPENTIAAIQGAIDSGAHWVEIDVQETADGKIVVIHDSDLKKIGGSALAVASSSARELQQVDIGSWFDASFSDQRIPTLQQVLELCRDRIGVNIELKYYGREKQLEQGVANIVEASGMVGQVMIMSLNYDGIKKMRRLRPDWTLGLLSSVALGELDKLDVDFLALNGRAASRQLIQHVQGRGKKIMVWTVNDVVGISTMMSRGVDAIITDEPALAVSILEQRLNLEPVQHILMQLADIFDQPSLYTEQ